mmetsp:Transcript_22163/g.61691  ORF Transcript_22163/g.61691 Transcript_22163/m.61691 type:complete len:129 (-) Transcript_22163:555-941(-)
MAIESILVEGFLKSPMPKQNAFSCLRFLRKGNMAKWLVDNTEIKMTHHHHRQIQCRQRRNRVSAERSLSSRAENDGRNRYHPTLPIPFGRNRNVLRGSKFYDRDSHSISCRVQIATKGHKEQLEKMTK